MHKPRPLPTKDANLLPSARQHLQYSERLNQLADFSVIEPASLRAVLAIAPKPIFDLPPVQAITDETIGNVNVRIYRPFGDGPFPVVLYYHGGGWMLGDLETANEACHLLASNGLVVVSVDYRLAPEHKFPTPFHDCYDALVWAVANVAYLNGDASAIYVAGDSAGGNISAAITLRCKDENGPALAGQILIYPATSMDFNNDSYTIFGEGYGLDKKLVMWLFDHYIRDATDAKHPYAAPLYADDVSGVPRALIFTAENDVLRDEIQHYADKLQQANVEVTHHFMPGLVHAYFTNYALFHDSIEETVEKIVAFIKR